MNANAAVSGQLRTFKSETCTCFAIDYSRSRPVRPVRVVSARAVPGFQADGSRPQGLFGTWRGCHVLMRGLAPGHILSRENGPMIGRGFASSRIFRKSCLMIAERICFAVLPSLVISSANKTS